jgi:hypothetical protein
MLADRFVNLRRDQRRGHGSDRHEVWLQRAGLCKERLFHISDKGLGKLLDHKLVQGEFQSREQIISVGKNFRFGLVAQANAPETPDEGGQLHETLGHM